MAYQPVSPGKPYRKAGIDQEAWNKSTFFHHCRLSRFQRRIYNQGRVIADLIVTEEEKDLVHAIYSLYFQLTPAEVGELLNHENPNVRVYGYLFYLSRTYDIYFDYLQESFKSEEQIVYDFPEIGFYHGKCYLGTMLMSFTLKGIQVPLILDISRTCCYGPTGEQHDSLYAWFSRKKDIEPGLRIRK